MSNSVAPGENDLTAKSVSKSIYLPGLNGLRALAALAVVISHITLALGDFGLNNKIFGADKDGNARGLDLAGYGVTIFFTLSGFLITYLLLKEKELHPLKIKDFYIRRALRIWPLYYLYLFICLATALIFGIAFERSSIFFYIFLAANIPFIVGKTLPFLAHFWSLGVEEQFYLLFPQLAKRSNNKLLRYSLILLVIFLLIKFFFWILQKRYGIELPLLAISVTRFHIMLIGVIAAVLYYDQNKYFILVTTHTVTHIVSWGAIFLIAINKFHIASVIDNELVAGIAVFLIMGQITRKNYGINLENKVCDFIGKISYGIYVIHPLFIFMYIKLIGKFYSATILNYLCIYFVILSTTIVVAYISYEFYEKRFLRLKAKFTTIESYNTKQE